MKERAEDVAALAQKLHVTDTSAERIGSVGLQRLCWDAADALEALIEEIREVRDQVRRSLLIEDKLLAKYNDAHADLRVLRAELDRAEDVRRADVAEALRAAEADLRRKDEEIERLAEQANRAEDSLASAQEEIQAYRAGLERCAEFFAGFPLSAFTAGIIDGLDAEVRRLLDTWSAGERNQLASPNQSERRDSAHPL